MNVNLVSKENLSRLLLITLLFTLLCSPGCSSVAWKNRGVDSYEEAAVISYGALGDALNISQPILNAMCKRGTLDADKCADAMKAYNNAVGIYKLLGTTAIMAIDTGDRDSYGLMQAELTELITQEVSSAIPLVAQLLNLGFKFVDLADIAENINISDDDKEAMKAAIINARNGVIYWKTKDGN